MKEGLIKIKTERVESDLVFDISEHNIYYDSIEGVYKRKLKCECNVEVGCFCFGNIEAAIESTYNFPVCCNRCYLKDPESHFVEGCIADLYPEKSIDDLTDDEIDNIISAVKEHIDFDSDIDINVCEV